MSNKKLDRALRRSNKKKEDKVIMLSGQLGIPLSGQKLVEVPNRQGFVFVRLKNNTSELIQAYNNAVSPIYDLPVLVARQTNGYRVMGRNIDRYTNQWGQAPYLPKHGAQHSFNPDLNIGGDIVWVYSQQFMPLLGYPSGSAGSPRLAISPYIIQDLSGNWKYVGNTGTPDVTPYSPTTGSRSVIGLLYIDTVSGNPGFLINSGTYMDSSLTGSNDVTQYIPRPTSPSQLPISAVRLVSGTTALTWDNVYDVRPFLRVIPTGTAGGSSGGGGLGVVGWDEGIFQGTGTILNATGQRVTLTASGTVLNLNISPDPIDNIGIMGYDDATPVGTGTSIVFGSNLTAIRTGTFIYVDAASSGGGAGLLGVMGQDEGVPLGTGTTFNFVGQGVTASISGSVINVSVPTSLIAVTSYNPSSLTTTATTSSTGADVDATNLAVTFICPASGKVLVVLTAQAFSSNGNVYWWGLRDTAGNNITGTRGYAHITAGVVGNASRHIYLTGLTPGTSYTYRWGHGINQNTGDIRYGDDGSTTPYGAAVMEVWAI